MPRTGEEPPEQPSRHGYAQPIGRDDQADEDADGKPLDKQVQPEMPAVLHLPDDGVCRLAFRRTSSAGVLHVDTDPFRIRHFKARSPATIKSALP